MTSRRTDHAASLRPKQLLDPETATVNECKEALRQAFWDQGDGHLVFDIAFDKIYIKDKDAGPYANREDSGKIRVSAHGQYKTKAMTLVAALYAYTPSKANECFENVISIYYKPEYNPLSIRSGEQRTPSSINPGASYDTTTKELAQAINEFVEKKLQPTKQHRTTDGRC